MVLADDYAIKNIRNFCKVLANFVLIVNYYYHIILLLKIPITCFKMNNSLRKERLEGESSLQGYLNFSSLPKAALKICTCQVC